MKITKGEYCRFSLAGRIRLLLLHGKYIGSAIITTKKIILYKLYDFYVAVIRDRIRNLATEANPVFSEEMLQFYLSL